MTTTRLVILVVTYLLIAVQRVPYLRLNRPSAALLGAVAMVTIGGLPLRDAYAAIDLDVMVFLLGVLLITGFLEIGGFFEWAARHVVASGSVAARAARRGRRDQRTSLGVLRERHDLSRAHAARDRGVAAARARAACRSCSRLRSGRTSEAR